MRLGLVLCLAGFAAFAQNEDARFTSDYDVAVLYIESGQLGKARAHLEALIKKQDRAEWHNLLGSVLDRSGDVTTAARELRLAAELDPNEKHLFDWANQFLSHGAVKEALIAFEYAAQKHPKSAKLKVGLGVALYSLSRHDEAVAALCAAVDLDPSDTRPLSFLGKMQDVSPKMASAVRERLAGFVKRYPDNAAANYYYALSLWQRYGTSGSAAEVEEVEALLKKAVALDPKLAEAHLRLAILHDDTGRQSEAVLSYTEALRLDPRLEQAHYRLARIYTRAGKKDLAARHLAAYRKLHGTAH